MSNDSYIRFVSDRPVLSQETYYALVDVLTNVICEAMEARDDWFVDEQEEEIIWHEVDTMLTTYLVAVEDEDVS